MLEDAKALLQELLNHNFEAYLIGGCVRDMLLNQKPTDFDLVTNAKPQEIISVFECSALKTKTKLVGKEFGVILVRYNQHDYEIATYRKESDYQDFRHPSYVKFVSSLEEDIKRRDFTINGIAMDIDGNIIDYVNGIEDLKRSKLTTIGDPLKRFDEDPLRMLRAIRFSCNKNLDIDEHTFNAISKQAHLIQYLPVERIKEELNKIIVSDRCIEGIEVLIETELFQAMFSDLKPMINFDQRSKYHNETLLKHSLSVVKNTFIFNDCLSDEQLLLIRVAAFLHDIGKTKTQTFNGINANYIGHALKSKDMSENLLKQYKVNTKMISNITKIIGDHDDTILPKKRHVYKFLVEKEYSINQLKYLMILKVADIKAHPHYHKQQLDDLYCFYGRYIEFYQYKTYRITDLEINGYDLQEQFNISGAVIGDILNHLRDLVFYNQSLNDKIKLLDLSARYLKKHQYSFK